MRKLAKKLNLLAFGKHPSGIRQQAGKHKSDSKHPLILPGKLVKSRQKYFLERAGFLNMNILLYIKDLQRERP